MKPPREIQEAIRSGDLATVEGEWLVRMEEEPGDLSFFVAVADALSRTEHQAGAELLELLDGELQERNLWDERLRLIREAGKLYLRPGKVHATVLATLGELYRHRGEELAPLLEIVGLDKGKEATTKLWDRVERLKSLLSYEIGTVVAMKDKGVGRVVDVNLALQTLKVDFLRVKGISVGLRAAGKLLEILPERHFLRRKLEAPEELERLRDEDPSDLLRSLLESYGRPLMAAEVREALDGVVPPKSWTGWWSAARKHPQLVVSGSGRQLYDWAESGADAVGALWSSFEAADPRGKLDLLRRAGDRDQQLKQRMLAGLEEIVAASAGDDPALAFELQTTLERSGESTSEPSAREIVGRVRDWDSFVAALGARTLRQRAYTLLREVRDDWPEVYAALLVLESDAKALDTLAAALDETDPERLRKLVDETVSNPRKAPATFTWIAERAASEISSWEGRAAKLAKQILRSVSDEGFGPQRLRLANLADSGGTLPRLLPLLSATEAAAVQEAIEQSLGLEAYQKQPLLMALYLRFPELQPAEEALLYTTQQSLEAKQEELRALLEEEIPANRRAIEEARALGDLRENFEYKSARQRHEYLSARASGLHEEISRARPLDPERIDSSQVRIGTRSELSAADGSIRQITILGPWESAPEAGIVSYESELAQQLLGKQVGDEVELGGDRLQIRAILPFEQGRS